MSISTHYSHQAPIKFGVAAADQQLRKDFQTLSKDLDSSDVAAAQKDFASLLNDASKAKIDLSSAQAQSVEQPNALSALSTSLQSGDVSSAKSALSSLNQAFKGHHHRHHSQSALSSDDASAPEGNSIQINADLQKLNTALQAGDVTTAQQALIQLQKDDPKLAHVSRASSATPTTVAV
jgi:hypothetical protein